MVRLSRRGFRRWLELQDIQAHVGERGSPASCPIANYLVWKGADFPRVDEDSFTYCSTFFGKVRRTLPKWAYSFIVRIDTDDDVTEEPESVTAEYALEVLSHI